jgi:DsbC/DsbD-like thiol-disulfide interchange protein
MTKLTNLILVPFVVSSGGVPANDSPPSVAEITAVSRGAAVSLKPVKWSVVGGAGARDVASGRSVPITLQADIAKGWHIYSLTQKPGGPIPLKLEVIGAPDVVVRGVVNAPKPDRAFDKNFGLETELYSGSPRFTIPVGVTGRAPKGIRKFQIGARYQVCSDKLCLPPRTDKMDVVIRIASRA